LVKGSEVKVGSQGWQGESWRLSSRGHGLPQRVENLELLTQVRRV
jgi:hypothetical protein